MWRPLSDGMMATHISSKARSKTLYVVGAVGWGVGGVMGLGFGLLVSALVSKNVASVYFQHPLNLKPSRVNVQ